MLKVLSQPYPLHEKSSERWFSAFGSGAFVFFFLLIFKPFGLEHLPVEIAPMIMAGYGLVTFTVVAIHQFAGPTFAPRFYSEERWTVKRQIINTLITVQLIALVNAVYTAYILGRELNLGTILWFQLPTFAIAVFPVSMVVFSKQMRMMRHNLREAESLSSKLHYKKRLGHDVTVEVTLPSDNAKESFSVILTDLMFIHAADNYIEVHYLENGAEKKKLLRSTLKAAREELRKYTAFYRCHRSYIVNLDFVDSISGNSQGLKLVLKNSSEQVPVSRNLNEELEQRLSR